MTITVKIGDQPIRVYTGMTQAQVNKHITYVSHIRSYFDSLDVPTEITVQKDVVDVGQALLELGIVPRTTCIPGWLDSFR